MLLLVPPCTLVALLLTAPAPAQPPPEAPPMDALHTEVLRRLASPEDPPHERDWAPLGPGALPELLALATDAKAPAPQRLRAIAAMAVVDNTEASQHLRTLARTQALGAPLRAAAMEALGRRTGVEALAVLAPLLTDPSEPVRAAAALTLGHVGGPEARHVLEARLAREEAQGVREALQQALSYLEP